jgi:hypothetical protein
LTDAALLPVLTADAHPTVFGEVACANSAARATGVEPLLARFAIFAR